MTAMLKCILLSGKQREKVKKFFSFYLVFVLFLMPAFSFGKKDFFHEDSDGTTAGAGAYGLISESCGITGENQENKGKDLEGFREDALIKKRGRIVVIGSEPHTYLGFSTDGGDSYVISRNSVEIPGEYQGLEMEVTGFIMEESPGVLYVRGYRVLK